MELKKGLVFSFLCISTSLFSQSYAPPAGEAGSNAIAADSGLFINWATAAEVLRGYINIEDPTAQDQGSNYASYGEASNAIGEVSNSVVSLGDAGEAILTFETPITNGEGYDFAVFESAFNNTFLELAFVEVSSDGNNYFRFHAHSETQTETQVDGFDPLDATYINNLAGKYRAFFGTPFDLSEVEDNALLDKNSITHVKIIDVVGSINPDYASYDSQENIINDPFPTPFYSGGFDLDGVGVIHEQELGVDLVTQPDISVYPNPTSDYIKIEIKNSIDKVEIYSTNGILVKKDAKLQKEKRIDISNLPDGIYMMKINSEKKNFLFKIIKK